MATIRPGRFEPKAEAFRGLIMVMVGLSMVAFSAYMLIASVQQSRRTYELVLQTRMMHQELDAERVWHVHRHEIMARTEHAVRSAILRKEALLRALLKRQFGWDDAGIEDAIRDELKSIPDDVIEGIDPEPAPPTTDSAGRGR